MLAAFDPVQYVKTGYLPIRDAYSESYQLSSAFQHVVRVKSRRWGGMGISNFKQIWDTCRIACPLLYLFTLF